MVSIQYWPTGQDAWWSLKAYGLSTMATTASSLTTHYATTMDPLLNSSSLVTVAWCTYPSDALAKTSDWSVVPYTSRLMRAIDCEPSKLIESYASWPITSLPSILFVQILDKPSVILSFSQLKLQHLWSQGVYWWLLGLRCVLACLGSRFDSCETIYEVYESH